MWKWWSSKKQVNLNICAIFEGTDGYIRYAVGEICFQKIGRNVALTALRRKEIRHVPLVPFPLPN